MLHTFLALRYLKGRHKIFLKGSNLLSMLGIFISVFSLLVVASVMNGFDQDMRRRVTGSKSEIKVYRNDYSPINNFTEIITKIKDNKYISGAGPVSEIELLAQNKKNVTSIVCYGIDYNLQSSVNTVLDNIVVGDPDATKLEADGILIGLDLSLTLSVTVGEYVQISSPLGTEPTPFGLLPKSKRLKVVGLFVSGLPEFDRASTYISLGNAGYFSGAGYSADHIDVKTIHNNRIKTISDNLRNSLGPDYKVEDWTEFDANLFNAIKMEKFVMYMVLILMMLIASFNMAGNFIKLVVEKRVEIGILKAVGASDNDIKRVFLRVGLLLGILGVLLGEILALCFLLLQKYYHLITIPVAGFPIQWLPVEFRLIDFIAVPLIAIFISYLTTLRPAVKTVKIDPIKIIRDY